MLNAYEEEMLNDGAALWLTPFGEAECDKVNKCVDKTPHELKRELARERKESVKGRDLDRRQKRANKRSQCY